MKSSVVTPDSDKTILLCDTAIIRKEAPKARFSLLDDMIVEKGSREDWDLLHDLHYKAENLPIGPRFWKLTLYGETIGVLVTGNPKGLLKERHIVFPNIKPRSGDTKITNTERYVYINKNMRVISRFVIDTMYRGIGCGYRMMNLVSRMEGNPIMEIQSSMSKFNMFGQKGGFKFVKPMNANKYEQGLIFFRGNFYSNPQDFEAIIEEINSKPEGERERLIQRCKDFYYRNSAQEKTGNNRNKGQSKVDNMDVRAVIKNLQQIVLSSPMYGVYMNPDIGRKMPDKLPLNAFDKQKPNERLVL